MRADRGDRPEVQPPFTEDESGELRLVTDWIFDRREFPQDLEPVDGWVSPFALLLRWGPWIVQAVDLMDGDGAFTMSNAERSAMPAYDLAVLRIVRTQWNKRVSERNNPHAGR